MNSEGERGIKPIKNKIATLYGMYMIQYCDVMRQNLQLLKELKGGGGGGEREPDFDVVYISGVLLLTKGSISHSLNEH